MSIDAEYAKLQQALAATRRQLLTEPLTLALGLSASMVSRPHNRFISQQIRELADDPACDRLMVLCPPQTGKTTIAGVWAPFWFLCHNPARSIVLTSYASSLAVRRGKAVRALIESHGHEFDLELARGSSANDDWETTRGGGMRSAGIDRVTGRSGDIIICDDPFASLAEANSPTIRSNVWDAWTGTIMTRYQPDTRTILIMTPWHPDDLRGRLLKEEGRLEEGGLWRVVELPAFARPGDALGRKPGQPLSHPKIATSDTAALTRFWNARKKAVGARVFTSLYMLDPQPAEGSLLKWETVQRQHDFQSKVKPIRAAVAIDPSGGGRDTAGIVAGYKGEDGRAYLTHDATDTMTASEWPRAACMLAYRTDADAIVWESNYGGDMAKRLIKLAWKGLTDDGTIPADTPCPRLVKVVARKGKYLRAEPVAQMFEEDQVRLKNELTNLEQRWCTWQPDDPDSPGELDACVYLCMHLIGPTPRTGRDPLNSVAGQNFGRGPSGGLTGGGTGDLYGSIDKPLGR